MMKDRESKQLTKAEMEIMTILWDRGKPMTTHEIIDLYPEPRPAYSTIATFLKILTVKGFVSSQKAEGSGKTFLFMPLISREAYTQRVMTDVKTTFFGGSLKSMLSFFVEQDNVSDEDLQEIVSMIRSKN